MCSALFLIFRSIYTCYLNEQKQMKNLVTCIHSVPISDHSDGIQCCQEIESRGKEILYKGSMLIHLASLLPSLHFA